MRYLLENIGLEDYVISLCNEVPGFVYGLLLAVFCLGSILIGIWKGKRACHLISLLLLIEYTFLIYCSTIIFRENKSERSYRFDMLWSYNDPNLLPENIMNVAVFVVFGFLAGLSLRTISWWIITIVGFIISVSIESLQYIFIRGSFDIDDVFNNTLGTAIGAIAYVVVCIIWRLLVANKNQISEQ